jgi:sensor histidine kinase YesM
MVRFFRTFAIGIIIGLVILIIDQGIRYLNSGTFPEFEKVWIYLTYYFIYAVPLTMVNSYFFNFLNTKINWQKYQKYRLVIGFAGSVSLTLVCIFFIRLFIGTVIEGATLSEFLESERSVNYVLSLILTLIFSLIFHTVYFYKELQKNKVKEQKVIAGTASAKFDALKNQLDPHFLFNSLNVLTSLIEENPESATQFTTSLSKVYRYVLEQKNKDLVTVDDELDFARTYMQLLKMRFEDSIIFEIPEKASNPESKVVPLSLQLLLENAVKHNIVTTGKPLHVKIYEENDQLVVENNIQLKQVVKKSSGVGLNNIKQRYAILTKRQVIINEQSGNFKVAIPMLTKQVSFMEHQFSNQSKLDNAYLKAKKRVEALKDFYYSVISYVVVIPLLFLIWYKFTPFTIQWFWFPMIGWGIGLLFQAYGVFVDQGTFGAKWEQRKIAEYMKEEQNKFN